MYSMDDVNYVASLFKIKFDKFTKEEFLDGLNIEIEHGLINPETNITSDHVILTAKIVLAHLNEYPNYYNKEYGLTKFEEFLKSKL